MTAAELKAALEPYVPRDCWRLDADSAALLASRLSSPCPTPESFGRWLRELYSPATVLATKGDPRQILNPIEEWDNFTTWLEKRKQLDFIRDPDRVCNVISFVTAFGVKRGVWEALSQGSDDYVVYRALQMLGKAEAPQYKEKAEKVLREAPWREV